MAQRNDKSVIPEIRATGSRGNEAPMVISPRRVARLITSIVRRARRSN
jgi:hypothetical protein